MGRGLRIPVFRHTSWQDIIRLRERDSASAVFKFSGQASRRCATLAAHCRCADSRSHCGCGFDPQSAMVIHCYRLSRGVRRCWFSNTGRRATHSVRTGNLNGPSPHRGRVERIPGCEYSVRIDGTRSRCLFDRSMAVRPQEAHNWAFAALAPCRLHSSRHSARRRDKLLFPF
jgi:hypothetical protein